MNEFKDDIFDEKKVEEALKKGKRKSILIIVSISILVFFILNIINSLVYFYFSNQAFKKWDAYIKLSTPNGYISETRDSKGFLGGETQYKVSKDMKIKSVVIEQEQYQFGLIPSLSISRGFGGKIGVTGEDWQFNYKENGWRELLFFHPDIKYKKYKNDIEAIEKIEGDKIYELALSFDKAYKYNELPLKDMSDITWLWMNTYNDEQISRMEEKALDYDWSANFIREREALGFSIRDSNYENNFNQEYKNFSSLLQSSFSKDHHKAYETIKNQGSDDIEILGMVIYGSKEELIPIIKKPFVKAISLGGIIDNY